MGRDSDRLDERRRTHGRLAAHLAELSDDDLTALLAAKGDWRANVHGNQFGVIEIQGAKVFVKQLALSDLEPAGMTEGDTANFFGLPMFYHYGVGSAGFGAWRELRAYLKASEWALSGACAQFPLTYHWRVTPRTDPEPLTPEQQAWVDQAPGNWDNSQAVRARLGAIAKAPGSIVLFLEHVPEMLSAWLERRAAEGVDAALEADTLRLHDQLREATAFMNGQGMLHFDLHTQNVLTDGEQVYIADFGLALCGDFHLAPEERAFYQTHRLFDRAYIDWNFIEWVKRGVGPQSDLPPTLSARVAECGPTGKILRSFLFRLRDEGKTIAYPAAEIAAAIRAADGP